mmetsp:Transcript_45249/g.125474  ORF Transcript_45249/g.125474 Transcript_45249/m.125474 type:complete len:225 (+) Transcript_45249:203-877(+)
MPAVNARHLPHARAHVEPDPLLPAQDGDDHAGGPRVEARHLCARLRHGRGGARPARLLRDPAPPHHLRRARAHRGRDRLERQGAQGARLQDPLGEARPPRPQDPVDHRHVGLLHPRPAARHSPRADADAVGQSTLQGLRGAREGLPRRARAADQAGDRVGDQGGVGQERRLRPRLGPGQDDVLRRRPGRQRARLPRVPDSHHAAQGHEHAAEGGADGAHDHVVR